MLSLRSLLLMQFLLVSPFISLLAFSSDNIKQEGPKPCGIVQVEKPGIRHGDIETDPIRKPKKMTPLGCERPFSYRGLIYSTDTPQAQDAVVLKSFVSSVDKSRELLDEYQKNRAKSKISAYTGTVGLLSFLFSNLISLQFDAKSRNSIQAALRLGGLSLAAGGFLYSFALLRTNEALINQAVDQYNKAKPNDPIELQFSTSWSF